MKKGLFKQVRMYSRNPKWSECISRKEQLYKRKNDIRNYFMRDYNRILHCMAYRRLKHKTQVFFATTNDHICTRIEHVNHVEAISYTIAEYIGLNTDLTNAISLGHDLGHPPFGHAGEIVLKKLAKKELNEDFWHEKNSLRFIDKCETIEDPENRQKNLNLTYAVRDGIVCHHGETNEDTIFPRSDYMDLDKIAKPNQCSPYTWEGCVVKISDKISYLGRDIQDALELNVLSPSQMRRLFKIIAPYGFAKNGEFNNTIVIHHFIIDLFKNSNPEQGIRFSDEALSTMKLIMEFSKKNIYSHPRLNTYEYYIKIILTSIYKQLKSFYSKERTLSKIQNNGNFCPILVKSFSKWLQKYSVQHREEPSKYENEIIYDLDEPNDYYQAIIDFISGMTDSFAKLIFNELTTF